MEGAKKIGAFNFKKNITSSNSVNNINKIIFDSYKKGMNNKMDLDLNQFYEKINKDVALKLSKISFSEFLDFYDEDPNIRNEDGEDMDKKTQFNLLKNYLNEHIKNNFQPLKRNYKFAKNKNEGRIFVAEKLGIQRLWNKFRGVLCDGLYWDVDGINMHPTLLLAICKDKNLPCYNLQRYVDNRAMCMNELMDDCNISKNEAKVLFIKSINSVYSIKKYNNKNTIKNKFFLEFDKELKQIQKNICELNPELVKLVKKLGARDNIEGKVLNHLLCKHENIVLQRAIKYGMENGFICSVPMFDGFLIQKNDRDIYDFIENLNILTEDYKIKWDVKPHNIEILEKLDTFREEKTSYIAKNIVEICDYMLETVLKNKIVKCENCLFLKVGHKWLDNEKIIKSELMRIISTQDYYIEIKDAYICISKTAKGCEDLIKFIIAKCETNENFIKSVFDNTLFKIFFNNGFYDFKSGEFCKNNDENNTFVMVHKNLKLNSKKEIRKQIYEKILYPIFGVKYNTQVDKVSERLMNYWMHRMARIMAGHVEDKRFLILEGMRNSGKGLLTDLLKNCFENYLGTTNFGNFLVKNTSGDQAKALSWLMKFQFKRLMYCNEATNDDKAQKVDGNIIKKINSGGDNIECRINFKDEREINIQSCLMFNLNDLPKVEPQDALEYCDHFHMNSKFIGDKYTETKLKNFKYYPKDDTIKTEFIKNADVMNEFILMLFEAYNKPETYPDEISKYYEDIADEPKSDLDKLLEYFEITGNKNDKITSKEFKEIIKDIDVPFTSLKAKKYLLGVGAENYRIKTSRGLCGIIYKNEDF